MKATIWVTPEGTKWVITEYRGDTSTHVYGYRRKRDAVLVARFWAVVYLIGKQGFDSVELVVQRRNGRIHIKDTYGTDPKESKG